MIKNEGEPLKLSFLIAIKKNAVANIQRDPLDDEDSINDASLYQQLMVCIKCENIDSVQEQSVNMKHLMMALNLCKGK